MSASANSPTAGYLSPGSESPSGDSRFLESPRYTPTPDHSVGDNDALTAHIEEYSDAGQTDELLRWLRERIRLPGYDDSKKWSQELTVAAREFLTNPYQTRLVLYMDPSGELLVSPTAPALRQIRHLQYFIKTVPETHPEVNAMNLRVAAAASSISPDALSTYIQYGTILTSELESLLYRLKSVYRPAFNSDAAGSLPDSIRREFSNHLHKLMASLTEAVYSAQGKTVLYVPDDDLDNITSIEHDKDLQQRLESTLIHWTRQIKEVVVAQAETWKSPQSDSESGSSGASSLEEAGPLDEIRYWRARAQDLSGLSAQLARPEVAKIVKLLESTQNVTYLADLAELGQRIEAGCKEANGIVKFLELLAEPCEALARATPDEIPDMLPHILDLVRVIWTCCPPYQSEDRIASLLRKISNQIIKQCSKQLSLDEIFEGNPEVSAKKLMAAARCGAEWHRACDRMFAAVARQNQQQRGGPTISASTPSGIYAQIDAFVQRCNNLLEICEGQRQFIRRRRKSSRKGFLSGDRGSEFEKSLAEIEEAFKKHLQHLRSVPYDILNVKATEWHYNYNVFKTGLRQVEQMLNNVISTAWESVTTVTGGIELLETLSDLAVRPAVRAKIQEKVNKLYEHFIKDLRSIQAPSVPVPSSGVAGSSAGLANDLRELSPLGLGEPQLPGCALWARGILQRIQSDYTALQNAQHTIFRKFGFGGPTSSQSSDGNAHFAHLAGLEEAELEYRKAVYSLTQTIRAAHTEWCQNVTKAIGHESSRSLADRLAVPLFARPDLRKNPIFVEYMRARNEYTLCVNRYSAARDALENSQSKTSQEEARRVKEHDDALLALEEARATLERLQPLVNGPRGPDHFLECNMDKELLKIVGEARLWKKLSQHFSVPFAALPLIQQAENLRVLREKVLNIVRVYNTILSTLSLSEARLFHDHLSRLDDALKPGFSVFNWTEKTNAKDAFLRNGLERCREVLELVRAFKRRANRVHVLIEQMKNGSLIVIERKVIYDLEEFEQKQQDHLRAAEERLKTNHAEIINILRHTARMFENQSSDVRNEWVKFVKAIDNRINSALVYAVRQAVAEFSRALHCEIKTTMDASALEEYRAYIEELAAQERARNVDGATGFEAYGSREDAEGSDPLIRLNVILEKSSPNSEYHPRLNPPCDDVQTTLARLAHGIPRTIRKLNSLMSELEFKGGALAASQSNDRVVSFGDDADQLQLSRNRSSHDAEMEIVNGAIKALVEQWVPHVCGKITDSLVAYWDKSKKSLSENRSSSSHRRDINALANELENSTAALKEVNDDDQSNNIKADFIQMDLGTMNRKLVEIHEQHQSSLLNRISKLVQATTEEVLTICARELNNFRQPIEQASQLLAAVERLKSLPKILSELEAKHKEVATALQVLDRYGVVIVDEERERANMLGSQIHLLNSAYQDALKQVEVKKVDMLKEIDSALAVLDANVVDALSEFIDNGPFNCDPPLTLAAAETARAYLRNFAARANDFANRMATLMEHRSKLSPSTPARADFHEIETLQNDIKKLDSAWVLVQKWLLERESVASDLIKTVAPKLPELEGKARAVQNEIKALLSHRWNVLTVLYDSTNQFIQSIPSIEHLASDAIKDRHWAQLRAEVQSLPEHVDQLDFETFFSSGLPAHAEVIAAIATNAQRERQIERQLAEIASTWETLPLVMSSHASGPRVVSVEEVHARLEQDQLTLAHHRNSIFFSNFETIIRSWTDDLEQVAEAVEKLLAVQFKWVYLESVVGTPANMRKQLPNEAGDFNTVKEHWRDLCEALSKQNFRVMALLEPRLLSNLDVMFTMLEKISQKLDKFLETKRAAFPRFYFLANDDLLQVLGQSRDPGNVQRHLSKIFAGIKGLRYTTSSPSRCDITGVVSVDGEALQISPFVQVEGSIEVESWLKGVELRTQETLRTVAANAYLAHEKKGELLQTPQQQNDYKEWIREFPGQIALLTRQVSWTHRMEGALQDTTKARAALKELGASLDRALHVYADLIRSRDLTPSQRAAITALIIIDVHHRQVTHDMQVMARSAQGHMRTGLLTSFQWLSQLRYYNETRYGDGGQHIVRQAKTFFPYGYEYHGNSGRLVVTSLTDRVYLTMTNALSLIMGCAPQGPAGTGKTETVKDLAKNLGRFAVVFNCSASMDVKSLVRDFSGLAQTGAWGCFDEFNRIPVDVLSVLALHVSTIFEAVRSLRNVGMGLGMIGMMGGGSAGAAIGMGMGVGLGALGGGVARFRLDGQEMQLNQNVRLFVTMNPSGSEYGGRSELPENLKALFRPIAMMVPDSQQIAEILLRTEGFVNAKDLAKNIMSAYKLIDFQLTKQAHYSYGLRALKPMIARAGILKREDPLADEEKLVYKAMKDSNLSGLVPEDVELFKDLLTDCFREVGFMASSSAGSGSPDELINMILQDELNKQLSEGGLADNAALVQKTIQLFEVTNSRHGSMLVGNSLSGKSTAWRLLLRALTSLARRRRPSRPTRPWLQVEAQYLNPKAVTEDELYGYYDPSTKEWREGIFSSILRNLATATQQQLARQPELPLVPLAVPSGTDGPAGAGSSGDGAHDASATNRFVVMQGNVELTEKWIVLDGPVDTHWIESMNSLLDDNKMLTLANQDRILLGPYMSLLFEVENLHGASPATVSRCGMVYFSENTITWQHYFWMWVQNKVRLFEEALQALGASTTPAAVATAAAAAAASAPASNSLSNATAGVNSHGVNTNLPMGLAAFENASQHPASHSSMSGMGSGSPRTTTLFTKEATDLLNALRAKYLEPMLEAAEGREKDPETGHPLVFTEVIPTTALQKTMSVCSLFDALAVPQRGVDHEEGGTAYLKLIEMWFLYACLWGVGGTIDAASRTRLDIVVRGRDTQFPPLQSCFDYVVDFIKRDWVLWEDKVPTSWRPPSNAYASMFVPTVDTARYGFAIRSLLEAGRHVLFSGPVGCGKSLIVQEEIIKPTMNWSSAAGGSERSPWLVASAHFTGSTTSLLAQEIVESQLEKRQRPTWGPAGGREKLIVVIDDLNAPEPTRVSGRATGGIREPVELLRQLIEYRILYERAGASGTSSASSTGAQSYFQPKYVLDTQFLGVYSPEVGGREPLSRRLTTKFLAVHMPMPDDNSIRKIYRMQAAAHLSNFEEAVKALAQPLANATTELFKAVRDTLLPTPSTPHYEFTMRDISRVIEGVLRTNRSFVDTKEALARVWTHEAIRVFGDRLTSDNDKQRLGELIAVRLAEPQGFEVSIKRVMKEGSSLLFTDMLNMDAAASVAGASDAFIAMASMYNPDNATYVDLAGRMEDLMKTLNQKQADLASRSGGQELVLFPDAVEHIVRAQRVLSRPMGHLLLLGVSGSGRKSVARFAAHCAGLKFHTLAPGPKYGRKAFRDDLRRIIETCGLQCEPTALLITDSTIKDETFMEDINSLLNCGEIMRLFAAQDDMIRITEAMRRQLEGHKQGGTGGAESKVATPDGVPQTQEALYRLFIQRARQNLRLIICMSPFGRKFRDRCRQFPGLVNCCTIDWFTSWSEAALRQVAQKMLVPKAIPHQKHGSQTTPMAAAVPAPGAGQPAVDGPTTPSALRRPSMDANAAAATYIPGLVQGPVTAEALLNDPSADIVTTLLMTPPTTDIDLTEGVTLNDTPNANGSSAPNASPSSGGSNASNHANALKSGQHGTTASSTQHVKNPANATKRADILVGLLCAIHSTTTAVSERMRRETGRMNQLTPTKFLDLIKVYRHLLRRRGMGILTAADKIKGSMLKLQQAEERIAIMRNEYNLKHEELVEKQRNTEKVEQQLRRRKASVEASEKVMEEHRAQVELAYIDAERKEAKSKEEAQKLAVVLENAMAAVDEMKNQKQIITEIRNYKLSTLNKLLINVLQATMVLLGREPTPAAIMKEFADGKFMSRLENLDITKITPRQLKTITAYTRMPGFDKASVQPLSTAMSHLCDWVCNVAKAVKAHNEALPLKIAAEEAKLLHETALRHLQESNAKLENFRAEIARLEDELAQMTAEANRMRQAETGIKENIDRAHELIQGFLSVRSKWAAELRELQRDVRTLSGDCLLAAAFLVYTGPLSDGYRDSLLQEWTQIIQTSGLPFNAARDVKLLLAQRADFVFWTSEGLPDDPFSLANGLLVKESNRAAYLVDPQGQAVRWLKASEPSLVVAHIHTGSSGTGSSGPASSGNAPANGAANAVGAGGQPSGGTLGLGLVSSAQAQASHWTTILENAIASGLPVLLENVPEELDPVLDTLFELPFMALNAIANPNSGGGFVGANTSGTSSAGASAAQSARQMLRGHGLVNGQMQVWFNDKEIRVKPGFRLFLSTCNPNPVISPEVAARCNVIDFAVRPRGLEQQLLSIVVSMEEAKTEAERAQLILHDARQRQALRETEDAILQRVRTEKGDLLTNPELAEALRRARADEQKIVEMLERGRIAQEQLDAARETYRPAAVRAAMLYFALIDMNAVDPMYQFSLSSYINLFRKSIRECRGGGGSAGGSGVSGGSVSNYSSYGSSSYGGYSGASSGSNYYGGDADTQARVQAIIRAHTIATHSYAALAMKDHHRLVFAFHACLRRLQYESAVDADEVSFLLKGPSFGLDERRSGEHDLDGHRVRMGAGNSSGASSSSSGAPAEFLKEREWEVLVAMEDTLPVFRQLTKSLEQHAAEWREWIRAPCPELLPPPAEWQNRRGDMPHLLLIKALRPDRLVFAIKQFLSTRTGMTSGPGMGLGGLGTGSNPNITRQFLDAPKNPLQEAYRLSDPGTPVLFLLSPGGSDPQMQLTQFAQQQLGASHGHVNPNAMGIGAVGGAALAGSTPGLQVIAMGRGQGPAAEAAIRDACHQGSWVYLSNVHLAPDWLSNLERLLIELGAQPGPTTMQGGQGQHGHHSQAQRRAHQMGPMSGRNAAQGAAGGANSGVAGAAGGAGGRSGGIYSMELGPHPDFRLWMSSEPIVTFPASLLQTCTKVMNEPPRGIRANMHRVYSTLSEDNFTRARVGPGGQQPGSQMGGGASSAQQAGTGSTTAAAAAAAAASDNYATRLVRYKRLLYSLAWMHAGFIERKRFGSLGWNRPYDFSVVDFTVAERIVAQYVLEEDDIAWPALRRLIAESTYGGRVTDDVDTRLLNVLASEALREEIITPKCPLIVLPTAGGGLGGAGTSSTSAAVAAAAAAAAAVASGSGAGTFGGLSLERLVILGDGDYKDYLREIDRLPSADEEVPELFYQHPNALIAAQRDQAHQLLNQLLDVDKLSTGSFPPPSADTPQGGADPALAGSGAAEGENGASGEAASNEAGRASGASTNSAARGLFGGPGTGAAAAAVVAAAAAAANNSGNPLGNIGSVSTYFSTAAAAASSTNNRFGNGRTPFGLGMGLNLSSNARILAAMLDDEVPPTPAPNNSRSNVDMPDGLAGARAAVRLAQATRLHARMKEIPRIILREHHYVHLKSGSNAPGAANAGASTAAGASSTAVVASSASGTPGSGNNAIGASSAEDKAPLLVVLVQESTRYNHLLDLIDSSLTELCRALQGRVVMTKRLEAIADAIDLGRVPQEWGQFYPSVLPLASWIRDLAARVKQLRAWSDAPLRSYWLGGLMYPMGLLSALQQQFVRRSAGILIDQVAWDFAVVAQTEQAAMANLREGAIITDLYLEGASWDADNGCLAEPRPLELYTRLPQVHFKPVLRKSKAKGYYSAPLYMYSVRSGSDTRPSYLLDIDLRAGDKAAHDPTFWIKRGAAVLLAPPL